MRNVTVFIFSCLSNLLFAQNDIVCHHFDERGRTREHTVDFESMELYIDFNTTEKKVIGQVNYQFTPLRKYVSSLVLDAPEIAVSKVLLDGKSCIFESTGKDLKIIFNNSLDFNKDLKWESKHTLEITYEAQPEKGLYFLGWDDETNRARKQIWTQGQGIDNRYWVPSFDDVSDKLITETYITFQNGYEVISNGDFIGKAAKTGNTTTWHYKMNEPHVMYLLMIAIGDFAYQDVISKNGVVNRQYYYPDRPEDFASTYQFSAEMMDWMEEDYGVSYPWGKIYRNVPVADFLYGAMENTTSTIFTDYYLQNSRAALERNYIGTNAHELTHQWFGDLITEWNGASHWLHESFATHYAKHFKRSVFGEDDFDWERYQEMQRAWYADDKNDLPVANSNAGSARHYPKGSVVIDMLRDAAGGDEQYKKVMTNYLKKYSFKHVDTHLFQMEFMETLGLNLDWFFDQWIYKGGYPHFEVSYQTNEKNTQVSVDQIQTQNETIGKFIVNVDIYVGYEDGTGSVFNNRIDSLSQVVLLPNPEGKKVEYVIFDQGNKIYKKLTFVRTDKELIAQAKNSTFMIDRFLALKELENAELNDKRKELLAVYENENFFATKTIIIKQLANDSNKKSKELIFKALQDENPQVRRACLDYTDKIGEDALSNFEALLTDSSFVTIEKTLTKLCAQFPDNQKKYLSVTENDALLNNGLRITWLELASETNKKYLAELVDFTGVSFEFRTRMKAMGRLKEMQHTDLSLIKNLLNAAVSFNRSLAATAIASLKDMAVDVNVKKQIESEIAKMSLDKNEQRRIDEMLKKLD